jgi:tetratricopeptide (TPR) repeat protein
MRVGVGIPSAPVAGPFPAHTEPAMHTIVKRCLPVVLSIASTAFVARAQTVDAALAAFKAGEWKKVFETVKAVPAASDEQPRALYLAGEAYLIVGQPVDAESCFRRVLEKRPAAVPAQTGLGRALTAQDKFDDAAKVLEAAAKADPKDVLVKQAQGELSLRSKKLDQARAQLAEAYALDPKSALVARSYCDALWAANDDENASKIAAQIAKALPKHPMGAFLQAVEQERAGKDNKAIELYEKALALDPSFLDAHKNLAILCHTRNPMYQDAKRTELSLEHYAKYFELGGNDPELKQAYDQFKGFMDQYFAKPKGKSSK